jgi:hypothetical protein
MGNMMMMMSLQHAWRPEQLQKLRQSCCARMGYTMRWTQNQQKVVERKPRQAKLTHMAPH